MSLLIFCKEWRDQISSTCVLHMAILAILQYTVKTLAYLNQVKAPWVVWASWLMSSLRHFYGIKSNSYLLTCLFSSSKQAWIGTLPSQRLCNLLGMRRVHKSLGSWLKRKSSAPKFSPQRKRTHEGPYLVQRTNHYPQATKVTGACTK